MSVEVPKLSELAETVTTLKGFCVVAHMSPVVWFYFSILVTMGYGLRDWCQLTLTRLEDEILSHTLAIHNGGVVGRRDLQLPLVVFVF